MSSKIRELRVRDSCFAASSKRPAILPKTIIASRPVTLCLTILALLFVACQPTEVTRSPVAFGQPSTPDIVAASANDSATPVPGEEQIPPSVTPRPTSTQRPRPTETPTATITPTSTPIGPCDQRVPGDDLLTLVTLEYGLGRTYSPKDLVPLSDFLPDSVTLGYPTELRQAVVEPLVAIVEAMQAAGLEPKIISGYRSYSAQAIAWNKWVTREPERASILSAPPGFSEHQLGTTVDFGTPELSEVVGQEDIEFHTYFYKTAVGQWLAEHAHEFGFTLSYPREAFELTGFYYEPWHFRYVGIELATRLYDENLTLTEYLLNSQPRPCLP
jgi:D-alanyl-D-alanine carboxypeptidase